MELRLYTQCDGGKIHRWNEKPQNKIKWCLQSHPDDKTFIIKVDVDDTRGELRSYWELFTSGSRDDWVTLSSESIGENWSRGKLKV
jgi:hypothetical protein